MKTIKLAFGLIIITSILFYSCRVKSDVGTSEILTIDTTVNDADKGNTAFVGPDTTENFLVFIQRFSSVPEFQLSRVKFPFKDCFLNANGVDTVCENILQAGWIHLRLVEESEEIALIFDNYHHEFRNNNERVFSYQGIENDVAIYYYFEKENGVWYLFKRENFSD